MWGEEAPGGVVITPSLDALRHLTQWLGGLAHDPRRVVVFSPLCPAENAYAMSCACGMYETVVMNTQWKQQPVIQELFASGVLTLASEDVKEHILWCWRR